jgi:hypothetical protein
MRLISSWPEISSPAFSRSKVRSCRLCGYNEGTVMKALEVTAAGTVADFQPGVLLDDFEGI